MDPLDIDQKTVEKLLCNLKSSKAPGPDGIHPTVLTELAAEVAVPLTIISRSSLSSGTVPQSWKTANIAPIFKKGDKRDPSNYRAVSLTCESI